MESECIHGLETALCGVCSPRSPAQAAQQRSRGPVSRQAPRVRTVGSVRTRGAAEPLSSSTRRLTALRVHHLTPIENLPGILDDGALVPGAVAACDLSSALTRQLRSSVELPGGVSVADAVPFYLDALARHWIELLDGASGPTWSDAARSLHGVDLVVLSWPVAVLADRALLADGDAAARVTGIVPLEDAAAAQAMFSRLERDERVGEGELLVPGPLALDDLALVGVANEPARNRVAALFEAAGLRVRTAVHPPWFQAPERAS